MEVGRGARCLHTRVGNREWRRGGSDKWDEVSAFLSGKVAWRSRNREGTMALAFLNGKWGEV